MNERKKEITKTLVGKDKYGQTIVKTVTIEITSTTESEEKEKIKLLEEALKGITIDGVYLSLEGKPITETKEEMAEVPEEKIPEGVEVVKYVFVSETDAGMAETMFEAMGAGKAEFRSAVNLGTMVRCVMYEKDEKWGTPIRVAVMDKDMAWHLQQLIDWVYRKQAKILAVKKDKKEVSVAFRMEGIKPPPPKEKMFYQFKKTDGWSLVGESK